MLEGPGKRPVGSGKSADQIGIDALAFLGNNPDILGRFVDLSGLTIPQMRAAATKPAFFVGLLDFILAQEPTVMAFAAEAGLDPAEVGKARETLAGPSGHA